MHLSARKQWTHSGRCGILVALPHRRRQPCPQSARPYCKILGTTSIVCAPWTCVHQDLPVGTLAVSIRRYVPWLTRLSPSQRRSACTRSPHRVPLLSLLAFAIQNACHMAKRMAPQGQRPWHGPCAVGWHARQSSSVRQPLRHLCRPVLRVWGYTCTRRSRQPARIHVVSL